jgi:hypothetical protein
MSTIGRSGHEGRGPTVSSHRFEEGPRWQLTRDMGTSSFYSPRNAISAVSSAGGPDPNSRTSRWILATIEPAFRPQ